MLEKSLNIASFLGHAWRVAGKREQALIGENDLLHMCLLCKPPSIYTVYQASRRHCQGGFLPLEVISSRQSSTDTLWELERISSGISGPELRMPR